LLWARHHRYAPGEKLFSREVAVFSLWYIREGFAVISHQEKCWRVHAGQGFLGHPCTERLIETPEGAEWLSAGIRLLTPGDRDLLEGLPAGPFELEDRAREELEALLSLLVEVAPWTGDGGLLARDGLARALAGWLIRWRGDDRHFSRMPEWVQRTLERIEIEPSVTVETLAHDAHFSPAQFRRLFQRYVGSSPRVFLQDRRLELGRRMVETTTESIELVAGKCGFGGAVQFSREFKRHYGLPPLAWRRASREGV
jgi:AraC-like DNA-binding protein